jgi:hypothetical protein
VQIDSGSGRLRASFVALTLVVYLPRVTCDACIQVPGPERETALSEFYEMWKHEPLVILKWLGLQVCATVGLQVSSGCKLVVGMVGIVVKGPG